MFLLYSSTSFRTAGAKLELDGTAFAPLLPSAVQLLLRVRDTVTETGVLGAGGCSGSRWS